MALLGSDSALNSMIPTRKQLKKIPLTRVELHAHLDGCVRHETIWELAKHKGIKLPGKGTFEELREALLIRNPKNLSHFLRPFLIYLPAIAGDLEALERIAYEFCEDKAKSGVAYVEARYSPHFFVGLKETKGKLTEMGHVIRAINRGFAKGENDFGIKVRTILSGLNGAGTINDILELCKTYKGEGVVGMDIASSPDDESKEYVEVPLNPEEIAAYEEARKCGIHRTLHAGEAGGAVMVQRAVEIYQTERVGHGYHVIDDEDIYKQCKEKRIHFETCPWSSYLTGAVPLATAKHPIVRFAEDDVNFSINTDDTTVIGSTLQDDYDLISTWGLTEIHKIRANINAARSCFLPENERNQLVQKICKEMSLN